MKTTTSDSFYNYLQNQKLEIIHEEKDENFWSIKAYKGATGSMIIGNIREAEVMISGSQGHYDLILSTGAWARNILIRSALNAWYKFFLYFKFLLCICYL
ncbi:MAG: hypothetical protein WA667_29280 [Candidatus Nitrosopolaris sp.]